MKYALLIATVIVFPILFWFHTSRVDNLKQKLQPGQTLPFIEKILSIWTGLMIIILVCLLLGLWYFDKPSEVQISGLLMPGKYPNPVDTSGYGIPPNAIKLFLGNNLAWTRQKKNFPVLRMGGKDLLVLNIEKNGVYLSAIIFREDGRIVAKIINNQFKINPNNYFELIRPNRHEIAVKDKFGERVLFVKFLNETAIYIEGKFYLPGYKNSPILVNEDGITTKSAKFSGTTSGENAGAAYSF